MSVPCPCGASPSYKDCCQPLHQGAAAPSAEALMRSRYAAFVLRLPDYLLRSWHPSRRPAQLDLADTPDWTSLQVVHSSQQGDTGKVHFQAIYRLGQGWGCLEEVSDFVREEGHWFYLAGEPRDTPLKPGRNLPCPCGSGKKYKVCCA